MKLADAVKAVKAANLGKYANAASAKKFATHVVPEVVRPARVIWNQAIGGVFILFAVLFLSNAFRYYDAKTGPNNVVALGFSVFLGAIMGFFGVASFLKARRIARRS